MVGPFEFNFDDVILLLYRGYPLTRTIYISGSTEIALYGEVKCIVS